MTDKQAIKEKTDTLNQLTAAFCEAHLDEEYAELVEQLIRKLSRKRDVPFKRGKLETWAAATIYAIGQINFLFDKSFEPYATPADIAKHFGASKSTISQKAKKIRDMFDMQYWDAEFSTTRMSGGNPLDNLMMENGFIVPSDAQTNSLGPASLFTVLAKNTNCADLPEDDEDWLDDIAAAWLDAREAVPWGEAILEKKLENKDMYLLAPHIFCRWRGQDLSAAERDEVIEMTVRNYLHSLENAEAGNSLASSPLLSFAFCWLVAHCLANRLDEETLQYLINLCAEQESFLAGLIDNDPENLIGTIFRGGRAISKEESDAQDKRIEAILGDGEGVVEENTVEKYATFLQQNLQLPCEVTGIEDFRWEEFYVFGPGDQEEYEELKKERPSYIETFELIEINREWGSEWMMYGGSDIGVRVRRISDGKEFTLGLSELKTTDTKSHNHQLIDDYAVWFVNSL